MRKITSDVLLAHLGMAEQELRDREVKYANGTMGEQVLISFQRDQVAQLRGAYEELLQAEKVALAA